MTVHIDNLNAINFIPRSDELVVVEIEAAGSDDTDATPIVSLGRLMHVYVFTDDSGKGVKLPDGELGDMIYIFGYPASPGFHVYKPDGTDLGHGQVMWRFAPYGWSDFV